MTDPKTILITGASSGLGAALASAYATPDSTLLLTGRNEERLRHVATQCKEKGATVECKAMDVTARDEMVEWIQTMDAQHAIDCVFANAGISLGSSASEDITSPVQHIFDVNVDGVLNTILPIIPAMQKRRNGQIAIVSSLASYRALPGAAPYSASKAAVRFYGEALRGQLWKDNIFVTVITPGYIKTPLTDVNQFPMPGIISAEKAATIIQQRMRKKPARIAFPFWLYSLIASIGALPPSITDPIFRRLPGK